MKLNFTPPDPITIPVGDGSIQLFVRLPTGPEAMAAVDAIARGNEALYECVKRFITDWSNIVDQNDKPVPFRCRDENGLLHSNIDKVFGVMPHSVRIKCVTAICEYLGLFADQASADDPKSTPAAVGIGDAPAGDTAGS